MSFSRSNGIIATLDVVTSSKKNIINKFAENCQLKTYPWPPEIKSNYYDLGVVVSFGHLIPENIIQKFPLGILNVHGSLLPKWRGAAPLNYTLANGDKETGITIMTIKPKQYDIGEILYQQKLPLSPTINFPELYEKMAELGANCLLKTLNNLEKYYLNCKPQQSDGVSYAPKITQQFGDIRWNSMTALNIFNLQRALYSIFPLKTTWNSLPIKLVDIVVSDEDFSSKYPGHFIYDNSRNVIVVECAKCTFIHVKKIGVAGKKLMSAKDFNNGYLRNRKIQDYCFK